ncbi:hypothetical protein ACIQAA_27155 [Neobacillus sp. NPDC093182]|uniref:hypothetical protein n=1 Tax=Neobacillus sp. NPDC093182 TaxID=3364297 RepID=UPI0037F1C187
MNKKFEFIIGGKLHVIYAEDLAAAKILGYKICVELEGLKESVLSMARGNHKELRMIIM